MSRTCPPLPSVRSPRPSIFSRRAAAFTIVELLVAASITLVVLGLMLQVTFSVLKTFDSVSGSTTARTQATTAFNFLRQDFQSIVWRRDNNVWLLATIQDDQTAKGQAGHGDAEWGTGSPGNQTKPSQADAGEDKSSLRVQKPGAVAGKWIDLKEYRFGQAGVWLRFFTNQATSTSDGYVAPIAVAYQIVRMKPRPNSTEYRYQLFRSTVRSGRSSTNPNKKYTVADVGYNLAINNTGGYNRPRTPVGNENDSFGDAGSVRLPDRSGLLANNVIDFGVRFWRKVPPVAPDTFSTVELLFPADNNFRPSEDNKGFAVTALAAADIAPDAGDANGSLPPAAELTTGYPDFVDIFMRVLTDEGARLIEALENKNTAPPPGLDPGEYWWQIAEQHSEVFTERILLSARPL